MPGERYPHIKTADLVSAYRRGATLKELGQQTGMNPWCVRDRLVRAGQRPRPRGAHNKPRATLEEIWEQSVDKAGPDDCWLWTGSVLSSGYGRISCGPFRTTAQRYAVMREGVTIPEGYEVDHLCFNPRCVNVAHLEVVTSVENKRRRRFALHTHCRRGHALTEENLILESGGKVRRCRICRQNQRERATRGELA